MRILRVREKMVGCGVFVSNQTSVKVRYKSSCGYLGARAVRDCITFWEGRTVIFLSNSTHLFGLHTRRVIQYKPKMTWISIQPISAPNSITCDACDFMLLSNRNVKNHADHSHFGVAKL